MNVFQAVNVFRAGATGAWPVAATVATVASAATVATVASAATVATVAGVAGCSSGPTAPKSIAVTHYRGVPPGTASSRSFPSTGVGATWRNGRLEITTWGSGSCPGVPTRALARGSHAVEVTISADYEGACTTDLSPTTSVIDVPSGIAAAGPLVVTVRGTGRTGRRTPVTITVRRP